MCGTMQKPWEEMTVDEINKIKSENCKDCIYAEWTGDLDRSRPSLILCCYILKTGKRRGCSPMNCTRKEKIKEKRKRVGIQLKRRVRKK